MGMRVCLIGNGRNIHFKRWAVSLKERGLDVCTHILNQTPAFSDVPNHEFDYRKIPLFNSRWRSLKFFNFLQSIHADIYHLHSLFYNSLTKEIAKMKNLVITPYGSDIMLELPAKKLGLKKRVIENAKLVTTSSKFLLNRIAAQGYKLSNQEIIYFGVDRNLFKPAQKETTANFRIGFVKHLIDFYGIEYLIKAFELVLAKKRDVELHIYGEGPLQQKLTEYISSHNLHRNVFLMGAKEHSQLPPIYNQFHLFVMPTLREEAFGVAAIEAQACGIPVIASNTGGIPEAVMNGKTGILVEPGNINQIADAIETLLHNQELRTRMSKSAVEWSRNFDWEKSVSAMIQAYETLM